MTTKFDTLVKAECGRWYSPCGVVTMADRGFEGNFSPELLAEARYLYSKEMKESDRKLGLEEA